MSATRTQQRTKRGAQKTKPREMKPRVKSPQLTDLKGFIVSLLRKHGALTRGEITTRTGIPRTTVYDTLTTLLLSGVVDKYIERNGRRGRPAVFYQLADD